MFKEKEIQLKNKLKNIIAEIGHRNDIKQAIGKEFKLRNLDARRAIDVFTGILDLNTLTSSDFDIRFLFLFSFTLNKVLKEKNIDISIDVQNYFTQKEYRQWKDYSEEVEQKDIRPVVFKDVQEVGDRIWQTVLTAQEMHRLDTENHLIYNFKTQRNPKITVSGEQINVDKRKVNEIKERLLNNEQYPDHIKLNIVNVEGERRPVYNEKDKTLTLLEEHRINIFDGWHRKTANSLAVEENPDLRFNWPITITFLSEKQAHDFMVQIDKQKKIKTEYIQQMDYNRPENLVVDVIINDKLSQLAKVMKEDDAYIRQNRALTKKIIVSQAIKECYEEELKSSINIRGIGNWIVEFTDYLMGLYSEEFIINPYKIKETSMINHKNMFYAYIALSVKLRGNNNWKEILREKMQLINFSKDNQLWKDLGMLNNKDANKALRKKLYRLFEGGV